MSRKQHSQWEFGELLDSESESRKVYTVTNLNRAVKSLIEGQLGSVWVEGQITGLRRQSSGHLYFSIKDEQGQISCALFRGFASNVQSLLKDGELVLIRGDVTLYEPRGQYQVIVRQVELKGRGALQVQFERLKAKLEAEGLFAPTRKVNLPLYPNRIGIVTSGSGAALRDVVNVIQRRYSSLELVLVSCRVQGEGASTEMANAVRRLNEWEGKHKGSLDLILLTRGGGSMEDLWAFNEEVLARAVFDSGLPIVSAVGHEIDILITDFVADVRAATPSAAAELITEGVCAQKGFIEGACRRVFGLTSDKVSNLRREFSHSLHRLKQAHPERKLMVSSQMLDDLNNDLQRLIKRGVDSAEYRLIEINRRLAIQSPGRFIERQKERLSWLLNRLKEASVKRLVTCRSAYEKVYGNILLLSPESTLSRGYSITSDDRTGKIIRDSNHVESGQKIITRLKGGEIISTVARKKS